MKSITRLISVVIGLFSRMPESLIALLGRFSIAAIFWKSGQTKIDGLKIDLIEGHWDWGVPTLSDNAVFLFAYEYDLPFIAPALAATFAAIGEHLFPVLLLLGIATRFSAFALLMMTLVIQIFVYPEAYPTHGVWAAVLLYLMARGPGKVSVDHFFSLRSRG